MLRQILSLIKLFGVRKLARMNKRHKEALPFIRGYCASVALWTLLHEGFLDELSNKGTVDIKEYAERKGLARHVLDPLCDYLDGIGILRLDGRQCRLAPKGERFMEEPRGLFDLLSGYEPVFGALTPLLKGEQEYGRDVSRLGAFVAKGSGELGRQLPFPVMRDLIRKHGVGSVMDIGCGDCEFLEMVCDGSQMRCYGFDADADAVAYARKHLESLGLSDRIEIFQADMFDLGSKGDWPQVEALTALDVFHEYLYGGNERIATLLAEIKRAFPKTMLFVAEFCRQPHEWLRKHPTAFLEHELFHSLTKQVILTADEWRKMFADAGYTIVEERVYDLVGHGYFALA